MAGVGMLIYAASCKLVDCGTQIHAHKDTHTRPATRFVCVQVVHPREEQERALAYYQQVCSWVGLLCVWSPVELLWPGPQRVCCPGYCQECRVWLVASHFVHLAPFDPHGQAHASVERR